MFSNDHKNGKKFTGTDLGAVGGDGAGTEPILEFSALVIDAVVDDDGRDEAEACIRGVDAQSVDAPQEKLERLAHAAVQCDPRRLSSRSALRRLKPLDAGDSRFGKGVAAVCIKCARRQLCLDEWHVNDVVDACASSRTFLDAVTNLGEDAEDPREARCGELEVVFQAVPKGLVKRLPDAMMDGILRRAPAGIVELKSRIHQQLMGHLLVCHPSWQSSVSTAPAAAAAATTSTAASSATARGAFGIKLRERVGACNLHKLAAEALNLSTELYCESGLAFVRRKMRLGVVEGAEGVLDANSQLGLVGNLPSLEVVEIVDQEFLESGSDVVRGALKRLGRDDIRGDAMKGSQQRNRRVKKALFQRSHRLKDMCGAVCNHVCGQKHAHIDSFGASVSSIAVPQSTEGVDAMKTLPGLGNRRLLAQQTNQRFKAAAEAVSLTAYATVCGRST